MQRSPRVLYGVGDPTVAALQDRAVAAAFLWRVIPKTVRWGSWCSSLRQSKLSTAFCTRENAQVDPDGGTSCVLLDVE
jgi:hypothetical protein